jgi:ribosomal protein S18 acetylase RimI-like enzyme
MRDVERLLQAGEVVLEPTDPEHPDHIRCVAAYFAELNRRSDNGFDPEASVKVRPEEVRPPRGLVLVARLRGEAVGCAQLRLHPDDWCEIKRMWVAESARGLGIGRRLLVALEDHARASGARIVRMDTNHHLVEAIALYRSAGYVDIPRFNDEPFADHWFEKRL